MHQNLGTSDVDVVGILNQSTIKAGKLARPSQQPRRGPPRAAKSQSNVTEVVPEQDQQHGDDSGSGDSYQDTPKSDSSENETVPDNDRAEDIWSMTSSEAESDESDHGLELFGQNHNWKGITATKKRIKHWDETRLELRSRRMKALVKVIEGARQVYQSTTEMPEISEAVTKLYRMVADLSEASCKGRRRRVITAICFYAVPQLVDLLEAVFKARRRELQDEDNLAALEEVIYVQDCLLILCTKARDWRAKPNADGPAKQPVRQIRPRIDSVRSGFRKEYDRRKVLLKRISNQARSRAREEARIQSEKEECEERQRRLEARRRQVREDVLRSQMMSSPQRHRACKDGSMVCKASQSAP